MQIFLIEDFYHLTRVSPVVHLQLRISPQIFEKIRNGRNDKHSGAWGKLIHEKKPEVENLVTLSFRHTHAESEQPPIQTNLLSQT
jgi:hypothetical protein